MVDLIVKEYKHLCYEFNILRFNHLNLSIDNSIYEFYQYKNSLN